MPTVLRGLFNGHAFHGDDNIPGCIGIFPIQAGNTNWMADWRHSSGTLRTAMVHCLRVIHMVSMFGVSKVSRMHHPP